MYSFVGDPGGDPAAQGQSGGLFDVTGFLSPGWLANPGLLEFRFSYVQSLPIGALGSEDLGAIPEDIQVFRDYGATNTGFQLQAVSAPIAVVPEPSGILLSICGAFFVGLSAVAGKK